MRFRRCISPKEERALAKLLMNGIKDYPHVFGRGSLADTSEIFVAVRRFYEQESYLPTENLQADIVSSHCEDLKACTPPQLATPAQPQRFAAEFDLLLGCCSKNASALDKILALHPNWERVFQLAEHHRLLPVLFSALRDQHDVPGSIQSAIRARFQNHIHRVLRFSAELARVRKHFAACSVSFLAHKGPTLGHLLYGDPAMRQFGDLDLLVAEEDVPRARSALLQLGYDQRLQLTKRQEKDYIQSGYEYVFGLGTEQNLLELQWRILPRFYSIDFDMRALFERSIELQFEGFAVRTLGAEDLMLVLCVHAAKHEWSQLGMIRDIATLAQSSLNWRWIEAEAQRLGIRRIVGISLRLANDLFQFNIPNASRIANVAPVEQFARDIESRLEFGIDPNPESFDYFLTMMRLRERWHDRARFACRLATTPSVGEWESVRLPDSVFPLYRGVRMLRLLRRFSGSAN